jgi:hypothetical protein
MTDAPQLPFSAYPGGGRLLLDPPSGTGARKGYARDILRWCGYQCVYCALGMRTSNGWLQLSVDQVVPQQVVGMGFPREWVRSVANLVACCRPCNDLFNRDPVVESVPSTLGGFFDLRDAIFLKRRAKILARRAEERAGLKEQVIEERGTAGPD